MFFCHRNHIQDLEQARLLEVERAPREPGGPEASAIYTRASVCRFLTDRVLGQPFVPKIPKLPPLPPLHPDARN